MSARPPVAPPIEPLFTAQDVAAALRLKPATVRRMAAQGLLGYHRIGGELRFRRVDLERLLATTRREPETS